MESTVTEAVIVERELRKCALKRPWQVDYRRLAPAMVLH